MRGRLFIVSLVIVPLVAVAPAGATVLSEAVPLCTQPGNAFSGAVDVDPVDPIGDDDCAALCAKWVRLCRGAVTKAGACLRSAMNRVASLRKAECATLDDAAQRRTCRDGIRAEQIAGKESISGSVASNVAECASSGFAACILDCN